MKKICMKLGTLLMAALLTLSMVSSAFAAEPREYFDVPDDAWYRDAVMCVSSWGYMVGVGEKRFGPEEPLTRAMFVTALYRMAGNWTELPALDEAAAFSDVPADAWYAEPVAWAVALGITAGTGDRCFDPKAAITRQDMSLMLLRFVQAVKPELVTDDNIIELWFEDLDEVSAYARDAVIFCGHRGFFHGAPGGGFLPHKQATRAEGAQVLMVLDWQIVPAPAN